MKPRNSESLDPLSSASPPADEENTQASTQRTTAIHPRTTQTDEMLRSFKETAEQQKLPSKDIESAVQNIDKWRTLRQRQSLMEETLDRASKSTMAERNHLHGAARKIDALKCLDSNIAAHFEDIQNTRTDGEYTRNVTRGIQKLDRKIHEVETLQKDLLPEFDDRIKRIKDAEADRCAYLQEAINKNIKTAGAMESGIRDSARDQVDPSALQSGPSNPMQHRRSQIDLRRYQEELQRLQAPWPAELSVAAQPSSRTRATVRSGPSLER